KMIWAIAPPPVSLFFLPRKAEAAPERLFLRKAGHGRDARRAYTLRHVPGKPPDARRPAAEETLRRGNEFEPRLRPVAPFQFGAHVGKAVDETERPAPRSGPEKAGEKIGIVRQPRAAARLHHVDEDLVDFELEG